MMSDPISFNLIVIIFILAGFIKGIVGLGLPTVILALGSVFANLPVAMALLIIPSLTTNIWQAIVGKHFKKLFGRLWVFLGMAGLMVQFGGFFFTMADIDVLKRALGVFLIIYSLFGLFDLTPRLTFTQERVFGPTFGIVSGFLTGLTGNMVFPGVMFLQSINLPRDQLVQAMGMLFTISTASLAASMYYHGLISEKLSLLSASGLIPAFVGMYFGQLIRRHISESFFRKIFFIAIGMLGFYIVI